MKLAISGQLLSATHKLSQLLDVLESFGVDAIEIWPDNLERLAGASTTLEANQRYDTRDVAGAATLLRERGFTVACVTLGFYAAPLCFASGGGAAFTQALQGAIDAADTLGAQIVNCYNVGIPLSIWGDAVKPAAQYAASKGITITIENEAGDESGLPRNVAALCDRVASPGLGTQYDPCNYYHGGIEPYPAAYEVIKEHIRYVHLKGGYRYEKDTDRNFERCFIHYVPLQEAAFPIEGIMRRLKKDGYDGWVTLEPHVTAERALEFYAQEIPFVRSLL